jgi:hypothetical protein
VLALPDKPSIAVLPFQNLSADAEQEYFADGVVEDITMALSRFRWLFVIDRNSSFTYKADEFHHGDVGDHIALQKNDHGPSYRHRGVSQRRNSPKTTICEIFGVVRFSTFSTASVISGPRPA